MSLMRSSLVVLLAIALFTPTVFAQGPPPVPAAPRSAMEPPPPPTPQEIIYGLRMGLGQLQEANGRLQQNAVAAEREIEQLKAELAAARADNLKLKAAASKDAK